MEKKEKLTFRLSFYVKPAGTGRKHSENAGGHTVALMLRILIDGRRADMSLYTTADPALWQPASRRFAGGADGEADALNLLMDDFRARARHLFFRRLLDGERLTAAALRDALQAHDSRPHFLNFARRHNADFHEWVGKGRSRSSYKKYCALVAHLTQYVGSVYAADDVPMSAIDENFARRFVAFLGGTLRLSPGTIRLYITAARHITGLAQKRGLLPADPFATLRLPAVPVSREYLTAEELAALKHLKLKGTYARVRNLFLFSCYTGMAYTDLLHLRPEHVERDATGVYWLIKPREKNARRSVVRLVPPAAGLLMCLRGDDAGRLLRVPDNRTCNRYLKVLAAQAGIAGRLHFHMARHTFATSLLAAGIPIESVSLMLGHSRITTTQIYAQVTRNKISRDTEQMSRAFAGW